MTGSNTNLNIGRTQLFIGGEWREPLDGRVVEVINPFTEEAVGHAALAGPADIDLAVRAARSEFEYGSWARSTVAERAALMARAGELLAARASEFAALLTQDVGSPQPIAASQPLAGKMFLDWYAGQATCYGWEEERAGVLGPVLVHKMPVGVVGAIVPWNYPLGLSFPKLAPALLTGCTIVLKLPEETPLVGFLLAEVFAEAGLPEGVLSVIAADREASESLVRHPLVDKISFTGSTRAGRRIASLCGEQIKRCTLELGGKSAAIVLPDTDLDTVIPALAPETMRNNGQTCINQTRVLAPRRLYSDVVEALRDAVSKFVIGDPADPAVFIGPLVSAAQRERVEGYIAAGREEGARVVLGGGRPDRDRGYFVQPTVFSDVDNTMRIAQEEIFGPVVAVIPYDDEDDAVRLANDSEYGLSGSVWGSDGEHAKEVARRIRTGLVGVNQHTLDLGGPFGGFKQSGLGREYGREGIDEYVELQSITYPRQVP